MLGLDLSRDYYTQVVRPLIEGHFPQISSRHAAALIGWGSDVLANDDGFSRDHEWGPRCLIFLPDSLIGLGNDLRDLFNSAIPTSFMGYPTRFVVDEGLGCRLPSRDDLGDVHIEITTVSKYLSENLGVVTPQDDVAWLSVPENRLFEFTSGEVFFDGSGELTALRGFYRDYYPLNVWKYRLAYAWKSLGWDIDLIGLCSARGDIISSRNCLYATLLRIIKLVFLLNRQYSPSYPKWQGKEFYKLPHLSHEIGPVLEGCYLDVDVESVVGKLETICSRLIAYQNGFDQLPAVDAAPCRSASGFWHIDLQHIADQIFESMDGWLRNISLDGAVDQWITNQDFMLDINKLKLLSHVYRAKGD